jgi:hypothetical protein
VTKLKSPLLVIRRGTSDNIPIIGCVRSKIVFSDRPRFIFDQ